jgi:hypothetical protein
LCLFVDSVPQKMVEECVYHFKWSLYAFTLQILQSQTNKTKKKKKKKKENKNSSLSLCLSI